MGDVVDFSGPATVALVKKSLDQGLRDGDDLVAFFEIAGDLQARHVDLMRVDGSRRFGDDLSGWRTDVQQFLAQLSRKPVGVRGDAGLLSRVLILKGLLDDTEMRAAVVAAEGGEKIGQTDRGLMVSARRPRRDATAEGRGQGGQSLSPGLAACSAVYHFGAGFAALDELARAWVQRIGRAVRARIAGLRGDRVEPFSWIRTDKDEADKTHGVTLRERRKRAGHDERVSHVRGGVMRNDRPDFLVHDLGPDDDFPKGAA